MVSCVMIQPISDGILQGVNLACPSFSQIIAVGDGKVDEKLPMNEDTETTQKANLFRFRYLKTNSIYDDIHYIFY